MFLPYPSYRIPVVPLMLSEGSTRTIYLYYQSKRKAIIIMDKQKLFSKISVSAQVHRMQSNVDLIHIRAQLKSSYAIGQI